MLHQLDRATVVLTLCLYLTKINFTLWEGTDKYQISKIGSLRIVFLFARNEWFLWASVASLPHFQGKKNVAVGSQLMLKTRYFPPCFFPTTNALCSDALLSFWRLLFLLFEHLLCHRAAITLLQRWVFPHIIHQVWGSGTTAVSVSKIQLKI